MSAHEERCILGAILWDNKKFAVAAQRLAAADFSLPSNRRIYSKMDAMLEDDLGVDTATLSDALGADLEKLGGRPYLFSLTEGLPRGQTNMAQWVDIVAKDATLRRAQSEAEELVKQLALPGIDVDRAMQAHIERVEAANQAKLKTRPRMFESMLQFAARKHADVPWIIDGVIPQAGNGIMGGDPKASKSFAALDMGLSIACGAPWMGHHVPRKLKVGIVSREDDAGLTHRRVNQLIRGRREYLHLRDEDMYINTREHTADFKVTNRSDMDQLIGELGEFGAGFVVLDVFRSLHDAEENDNTEVAAVLAKVTRIQTELKCATLLVHHIAKTKDPNPFKGLRGASCIHGWMEFGLAITVTNPEEEDRAAFIRRVQFESKETTTHDVLYRIVGNRDHETVRLAQVEWDERRPQGAGQVSVLPPPLRNGKDASSGEP